MTAELKYLDGLLKDKTIQITRLPFTLGRAVENDLVIPDPTVSARHARITQLDGGWHIEDTSKNGTLVNGKKISSDTLKGGDKITIHPCRLQFVVRSAQEDKTRVLSVTPADDDPVPAIPSRKREGARQVSNQAEGSYESEKASSKDAMPRSRLILYAVAGIVLLAVMLFGLRGKDAKDQDPDGFRTTVPRSVSAQPQKEAPGPNDRAVTAIPRNTVRQQAERLFKIAEDLYNDRTKSQNLYRAILTWQQGFALLKKHGQVSGSYAYHTTLHQNACRMIEEKVYKYIQEAKVLVKQKDYAGAVEVLRRLLEMIPDQADPRHQQAAGLMAKYQRYMK